MNDLVHAFALLLNFFRRNGVKTEGMQVILIFPDDDGKYGAERAFRYEWDKDFGPYNLGQKGFGNTVHGVGLHTASAHGIIRELGTYAMNMVRR